MSTLACPPIKIANGLWLVPVTEVHESFIQRVNTLNRKAVWQAEGLCAPWIDAPLKRQNSEHEKAYSEFSYVIAAKGQWVGRLLLRATPDALHIIDMALLPEHQKQGIGQSVLGYLQHLASVREQQLTLTTESSSPSFHWYRGCGFKVATKDGIDCSMIWNGKAKSTQNSLSLS